MSQAGGKKGTGKGPPKKPPPDEDKSSAIPKNTDDKDETASNNGDKKDAKDFNGDVPKPPSASVNVRDAATKILTLAQKGEWSAVEQTLKVLEKLVAAGGEDHTSVPMAGILDPVRLVAIYTYIP